MNPFRAIAFKLGSVTVFVIMASLIKATAGDVPPGEAVFFRSAFALPIIFGWLAMRHDLRTGFRARDPMGHVWRGVIGSIAMGLGFAGLGLLPLSEVQAIGYAAPLLVVVFAAMFLGERVADLPARDGGAGPGRRACRAVAAADGAERRRDRCDRDAGRGAGAGLGHLRSSGPGLHPQDGPDRKHVRDRVLVLDDGDRAVAAHGAVWLDDTAGWHLHDAGRGRAAGRGRTDLSDLGLPVRRCGACGALRLCIDPAGGRNRLCLFRRGADDGGDRRARHWSCWRAS